jgi:hypothetical protein
MQKVVANVRRSKELELSGCQRFLKWQRYRDQRCRVSSGALRQLLFLPSL